jgi:hypothetical protein
LHIDGKNTIKVDVTELAERVQTDSTSKEERPMSSFNTTPPGSTQQAISLLTE